MMFSVICKNYLRISVNAAVLLPFFFNEFPHYPCRFIGVQRIAPKNPFRRSIRQVCVNKNHQRVRWVLSNRIIQQFPKSQTQLFMGLGHTWLAEDTLAMFAFCLNRKKLSSRLMSCRELSMTSGAIPFVFVFDCETRPQTSSFNENFVA